MTQMRTRFESLDALRGVAAFSVVLYHWALLQKSSLFGFGYTAVDLFFLLSGFVIAFSYEDRLRSGALSKLAFAKARLIRLYPAMFAGLLFGATTMGVFFLFQPETRSPPWAYFQAIIANLVIVPSPYPAGYNPHGLFPINGVMWTLFYELVANMVYSILAKWLNTRVLIFVVLCGLAGLCLCATYDPALSGGTERSWGDFATGTARVGFSFFLGVLIYRLRKKGALPKFGINPVVLCVALIAIFLMPISRSPEHIIPVLTIAFPCIVLFAANYSARGTLAEYSHAAGRLSYPLYATHLPILEAVAAIVGVHVGHTLTIVIVRPMVKYAAAAGIMSLVTAVSWLVLRYWDEPLRLWASPRSAPEVIARAL